MPLGPYEDFGQCVQAQKIKGHSDESARRICGEMQKQIEGAATREAAFERLTCRQKYATIKGGTVKVDWDGNQHKLLHVHNLEHTHVCVTADGEKHYERVPGGRDTAPPPPSEREGRGGLAELYVRESAIKEPNQAVSYQDKNKDKVYLKVFLIDGSVNQNHWGVRPDSIQKNIYSAIGKPVVLYQNTGKEPDSYQRKVGEYDHPYLGGADSVEHAYAYQDLYRIATYIDVFESSNNPGQWWGVAEVTDDGVKRALREDPDLPMYVSPTIRLLTTAGTTEPENAHTQWTFMHSAIVDKPAFGIDRAYIGGQCSGHRDTCLLQLRKAAIIANNNEIGCGFCTYKAVKEVQLRLRQASSSSNAKQGSSSVNSSFGEFDEKLQSRSNIMSNQNNDPDNKDQSQQPNPQQQQQEDQNKKDQEQQQQEQSTQSQQTVEQQKTTVTKKDNTSNNNNKQASSPISDLREALDTIQRLAAENKNLQMQLGAAKGDVDTHKQINSQYETRLASLEKERDQERAAVRKEQISNFVNAAPAYRMLSAQDREKQIETFVNGSMSVAEIQSIIEPLNASLAKQFQFPNRSASVRGGPSRLSLGANTGKSIEVRSASEKSTEDELPFYLQLPDAMGLGNSGGKE